MTLTIDIADELLEEQSINPQMVKEQIALMLYEKNLLTSFEVCQMLGITQNHFFEIMRINETPISYNQDDFEQDLSILNNIFPK